MSKAPIRNLFIEQGTDWSETFQILDPSNAVVPLTGKTFKGQARKDNDRTVVFDFVMTSNTTTNFVVVSVAKSVTTALTVGPYETHPDSKFSYDYEMTAGGITSRIQQGSCTVYREITLT